MFQILQCIHKCAVFPTYLQSHFIEIFKKSHAFRIACILRCLKLFILVVLLVLRLYWPHVSKYLLFFIQNQQ